LIQKQTWDEIISKISLYKYTSINHIEYEDISNSVLLKYDNESIILVDKSISPNELYFSTNETERMLSDIDCYEEDLRINFVPHDFVELFKNHGFIEWAEYVDFFNEDIQGTEINALAQEPILLRLSDCAMVSDMSKKCEQQSRGFTGESTEWFADWIKENDVILIKDNHEIIGFCCVSIYANGTILWIREIAVLPQYQSKGFGKKLIEQSIQYGVDRGAKRGFLAADILNRNAIGLYNSYGFIQKDTKGELQMIRTAIPTG